jgi:hypothetical protein
MFVAVMSSFDHVHSFSFILLNDTPRGWSPLASFDLVLRYLFGVLFKGELTRAMRLNE